MKSPCIIALDFQNMKEVQYFLTAFPNEKLFVKVGMELYYSEGPEIIRTLKQAGHHIFLDLKLHDIPNTVKSAMKQLAKLGVDMVNVHAAGGSKMMKDAIEGLEAGTPKGENRPICIAVTQLTSTSEEQMQKEQWIEKPLNETIVHFAKLAKESGLDGVVCSALEVPMIREAVGEDFYTVTPGIRMKSSSIDDQVRVVTPDDARKLGSSYIVVGRNITKAKNPSEAYQQVLKLWEESTS